MKIQLAKERDEAEIFWGESIEQEAVEGLLDSWDR